VQRQPRRAQFPLRPAGSSPNVTSAVGMEETAGRVRAKRSSLFTQTIIWMTGLICLALLLGTLAQAWSNSQLMQRVQTTLQQTQQQQAHHDSLMKLASHYQDPFEIETEARESLGYVRPNEHPVVIISSANLTQQSTPRPVVQSVQEGYWQEWWNVFFGN
jgi:cell division protein FtsB